MLYFAHRSRYAPPKIGEFKVTQDFPGFYVYKGRLLTIEEFNELPDRVFDHDRHMHKVRVKLVEVAEDEQEKPEETAKPVKQLSFKERTLKDAREALSARDVQAIAARAGLALDPLKMSRPKMEDALASFLNEETEAEPETTEEPETETEAETTEEATEELETEPEQAPEVEPETKTETEPEPKPKPAKKKTAKKKA